MFGDPIPAEEWMIVILWVWTYLQKENPLTGIDAPKARGMCNDEPRYGEAVTLTEMYAACGEQPIHQLTWAISASLNLYCKGYDVGNAFPEAPAPVDPYFIHPDKQFHQ